jgi:hypothetical protein
MGLSATEVMPTIKVINRLIFMSSHSLLPCFVAIARPQDFAVLLKSRCGLPLSRWGIECFGRASSVKVYSFSTDTSVALIIAKTVSPSLRFIRLTEPVVMIDVTSPAAVRMTISDTTLSETIFSIVPGNRFRMLVLMVIATLVPDCSKAWLAGIPPATNPSCR